MLTSEESQLLKTKLITALETTSRKDRSKSEEFKVLVNNMHDAFNRLKSSLRLVSECLVKQTIEVQRVHSDTKSAYFEKERLYRYQEYVVERNFLRGREAMEERVIRNVAVAFAEFAMINARRIRRLATIPKADVSVRESLYDLIVDSLKIRQELGDLAKTNLTVLYNAFLTGKRIFNYQFENISRSHNDHIAPKPLLNYSMHYNPYVLKYGPKVSADLNRVHNALDMSIEEAKEAYIYSTVDETRLNSTFERYLSACRTFMFSKSVFYSQGVDYPVPVLKERYTNFGKIWENIDSITSRMEHNIHSLRAGLSEVENAIRGGKLQSLVENLLKYIISEKDSKLNLSEVLLSDESQDTMDNLKDFFNEIKTRGQEIFDSWTMLKDQLKSLWTAIIEDEDMLEYYEFTNNARFLQNLNEVISRNNIQSSNARDDLDVREAIANEDTNFVHAMDDITKHLKEFKETIKIDSYFVRLVSRLISF